MYYQAQAYWYPNCCMTTPRVNRFVAETVAGGRVLEFRPRFGNGYVSVDADMTYGLTASQSYPVRILDARFVAWRTLAMTTDAEGVPRFSSHAMEAEGTLDADGRLDVREIMRIAGEEIGAHAGALILRVDPTYDGGGSPDTCYLVLRWDAR